MSILVPLLYILLQAPPQPPAPTPSVPPTDLAQEAVIVEQYVTKYRFETDGTGRREARARVKIQSDAGVQEWGQLVFGYSAGTERLEIEYVRVHKADGTVVSAPLDKAVQDLTSPVQQVAPVYTDFRQKHVTVPSLRPGETLEYSFAATIHTPLAAGHFWTEHDFQRDAIVLHESLEIDVPAARTVTIKTAADATPQVAEADGRKIYRWTSSHKLREPKKDDDTLRAEAEARAENPTRAAVRITTFQSWAEVGRWYHELEQPSRNLTPEIRRKAQELTAGRKTDMEKLRALYEYVAPSFRYVSISLGMGRYQPRPAADVLRDQYGDCKDKHTLLVALMEAAGLRASTVLIDSEVKLDPSFPSPSQFDHVITTASVDGQDVWMDVTTEVAPFRLLSQNLRKKQALVVLAEAGSRLAETPAEPPMMNETTQEFTGSLGALGTLSGTARFTARGDAELLMRTFFHRTPESEWKTLIEGINESTGLTGDVSDWKVSDPKATGTPFQLEWKVSKSGFVDWTKKSAPMKLPLAGMALPDPGEKSTRPVEFGGPTRAEYRLNLQLGEGYKGRLPVPVTMKRDYGTFEALYTLAGQQFTAQKRLELNVPSLPPDRLGDFRSFRRAVIADNAQTLSLEMPETSSDAAAPDMKAADLLRGGLDAYKSRNYGQAVTLLKRAVELEPKNTRALNALGDAYLAQRRYDDALDAYNDIVEVSPYDEFAHNDIGHVQRTRGRFADAEIAFRKQLELNPLDKYAHVALGEVLVELEKYDAAVPQLERAITLEPENANLRVELGTALLQLSKNEEALAAFTKAVELVPNPNTWNNVAYQLALKGVHLDRAVQYAESAVHAAAVLSRNVTLDHVGAREASVVVALSMYWDTLGWVHFAKGDLARAESLVAASWALEPSAEVGDHLAQIYEKQGRKEDAIRMYAIAMNADRAKEQTRKRLAALSGTDPEVLILRHKPDLLAIRSFVVDAPKGSAGMADFLVLLGENGRAEAVKFVSGEEKLRPMDAAVQKITFGPALPNVAPVKVVRRGTLSCTATGGCTFVLFPASHVQPVN